MNRVGRTYSDEGQVCNATPAPFNFSSLRIMFLDTQSILYTRVNAAWHPSCLYLLRATRVGIQ